MTIDGECKECGTIYGESCKCVDKTSEVEFKPWGKIPRICSFRVTITEKINGTNACIIIENGEIVGIQSRKRLITPESDNYGFAKWVIENSKDLQRLGDGYHYGEWAGPGIQKNPHDLYRKTFFLFNTFRWNLGYPGRPRCCDVVPVLYEGELGSKTIKDALKELEMCAEPSEKPEGVVVYYHAFRKYTKHTIVSPRGKWCNEVKL